jgi:hypothetical protein
VLGLYVMRPPLVQQHTHELQCMRMSALSEQGTLGNRELRVQPKVLPRPNPPKQA